MVLIDCDDMKDVRHGTHEVKLSLGSRALGQSECCPGGSAESRYLRDLTRPITTKKRLRSRQAVGASAVIQRTLLQPRPPAARSLIQPYQPLFNHSHPQNHAQAFSSREAGTAFGIVGDLTSVLAAAANCTARVQCELETRMPGRRLRLHNSWRCVAVGRSSLRSNRCWFPIHRDLRSLL
jgi:hypothetical protein